MAQINWDTLGFDAYRTRTVVLAHYRDGAWSDIQTTETFSFTIDPFTQGLHYAISCFEGATALVVPRRRFAPVKTTNDLLAVRSDLYRLGEDHQVTLHPQRFAPPPDIRLDPRYCKNIADFELRFPNGAPSLLYCDSLTVEGDIRFGRDVRVEGDVHLRNPTDRPATIPDGIRLHTPIAR